MTNRSERKDSSISEETNSTGEVEEINKVGAAPDQKISETP